jgi:hypothetical protein
MVPAYGGRQAPTLAHVTLPARCWPQGPHLLLTATGWAALEDYVGRIEQMATTMRPAVKPTRRATEPWPDGAETRADYVANTARVRAFELLSERSRAVKIMERRLDRTAPAVA